jgi:predicted transcriptional regulator
MTTLTVEIDKERDLPALQEVLGRMGLKFQLEENNDEDWGDLPEAAIEGIKAGLADGEAGRVHSHEYVAAYMEEKLNRLRAKKNG